MNARYFMIGYNPYLCYYESHTEYIIVREVTNIFEHIEGEFVTEIVLSNDTIIERDNYGNIKLVPDTGATAKNTLKLSNIDTIKYLINLGADIHAREDNLINWAAVHGYLNIVRLLIELGSNIHNQMDYPIRISVDRGHFEIVKLLIEFGANIRVPARR